MTFFNEYVTMFRPSLKAAVFVAFNLAQDISDHNAILFKVLKNWPACCICNRKQDFVFDFVKLYYYWDAYNHSMLWICDDHGRVIDYNCITGESIELPLPMPYWQRRVRNFLQSQVLYSVIALRFVWYYLHTILMWYMLIYPLWWMRLLKRKLCED